MEGSEEESHKIKKRSAPDLGPPKPMGKPKKQIKYPTSPSSNTNKLILQKDTIHLHDQETNTSIGDFPIPKNPPKLDSKRQNKTKEFDTPISSNITPTIQQSQQLDQELGEQETTNLSDEIQRIRSRLKPVTMWEIKPNDEGRLTPNKLKSIKSNLSPAPKQEKVIDNTSRINLNDREEMYEVFENRGQVINLEQSRSLQCVNCSYFRKVPSHCFSSMIYSDGNFKCKKCNIAEPIPLHCGQMMEPVDNALSFYQFINYARIRKQKGKYQEAIKLYQMSLEILDDLNQTPKYLELIAECKLELGQCKSQLGRLRDARFLFVDAKEIFEEIGGIEGLAKSTYYLGTYFLDNGELENARKYFNQAQALISEISGLDSRARILISSGKLHRVRGNYENAIREFKEALAIAQKIDDTNLIADVEMNLGITAKYLGKFDQAMNHLQNALEVISHNNIYFNTNVYYQLISVAIIVKDENQAKQFMDQLRMIYLDHKEDNYVVIRYRIAQALQQKASTRMIPKARALEEFKNILREGLYEDFEQQIFVMINVTDLLLQELQAFEDEKVLNELISMMNKIAKISKEEQSKWLFFQSSLIKFKLLSIQNKYTEAVNLLDELENFTESEELILENERVRSMRDQIVAEVKRIEQLSQEQQSIREKLKQSEINLYIQKAMRMIDIE